MSKLAAPLLADPAGSAVLTDFDGTLAPIVDDPEQAVPLPGAAEVLGRLASRYAAVGVVSGRPVRYLQERLGPVGGLLLAGLYGLERARDGEVEVLAEAQPWSEKVEGAAAAAERAAPAGVGVERKGLALTLHFRQAPHHRGWVERFAGEQAAATGLVAHPGRCSVELRPPVNADKGTVVAEVAGGRAAACYLGDDAGDQAAFAALDRLRRAGMFTLAVAVDSPEAPPGLLSAADVVVEGPAGALSFLAALAP